MFKSQKKEVKIARPLVLVVFDKVIGDKSPNREIVIRSLNLPFKLDLVKNEVWLIGQDEILRRNIKRTQAVIVNTSKNPQTVIETIRANLSVYDTDRKLLIHYTAKSYGAMDDSQKDEWRLTSMDERITPTNLSKLIPIAEEASEKPNFKRSR